MKLKLNRWLFVFLAVAFILALGGWLLKWRSSTAGSSTDQAKQPALITIVGFKYSPVELTVSPGQTVTVSNTDQVGHSVTSDDGTSFDTSIINEGQSKTFVAPTTPGQYPYHCSVHPNMTGVLTVR